MTIEQWIEQDGDYQTGVVLYEKLPKKNPFLLATFKRKQTMANMVKLRYELESIYKKSKYIISKPTPKPKPTREDKYYRKVLINQLPVELHPYYIKQKSDFSLACSLKIQLNAFAPEQEQEALELILQIDKLFTSIEKTWGIIDYYFEHKYIPKFEKLDVDSIPSHLWTQKRQNFRSQRTRTQQRIDKLAAKLSTLSKKSDIVKVNNSLAKANERLMKLNQYIISLTDKIDRKTHE